MSKIDEKYGVAIRGLQAAVERIAESFDGVAQRMYASMQFLADQKAAMEENFRRMDEERKKIDAERETIEELRKELENYKRQQIYDRSEDVDENLETREEDTVSKKRLRTRSNPRVKRRIPEKKTDDSGKRPKYSEVVRLGWKSDTMKLVEPNMTELAMSDTGEEIIVEKEYKEKLVRREHVSKAHNLVAMKVLGCRNRNVTKAKHWREYLMKHKVRPVSIWQPTPNSLEILLEEEQSVAFKNALKAVGLTPLAVKPYDSNGELAEEKAIKRRIIGRLKGIKWEKHVLSIRYMVGSGKGRFAIFAGRSRQGKIN
jgi:hypothetical protein